MCVCCWLYFELAICASLDKACLYFYSYDVLWESESQLASSLRMQPGVRSANGRERTVSPTGDKLTKRLEASPKGPSLRMSLQAGAPS